MPHRLFDLPPVFAHMIEAILLGLALGVNGASYVAELITEGDWQKMTGPHGGMFLLAIAVIALWLNKISDDKARAKAIASQEAKEDARRQEEELNKEKRHAETIAASAEYAYQMKALAVESMKVTMKVDHTLAQLTAQLQSRPCQASSFKPIPDPTKTDP